MYSETQRCHCNDSHCNCTVEEYDLPTLPSRAPVFATLARPLWLLLCLLLTGGCAWYLPPPLAIPDATLMAFEPAPVSIQPVTTIPLDGPLALRHAELSGLAWYGDQLVLLPQFPERFGSQIFVLPKSAIVAQLLGQESAPLMPQPIALDDGAVRQQLQGWEGYEAIAFAGERAYLTIEANGIGEMMGYVVGGELQPLQNRLVLDPEQLSLIVPQTNLANMADEALFLVGNQVVTIYEANGLLLNPNPVVHLFDAATLTPIGVAPFPSTEYRITDVTELDAAGRFWATNYFAPESGYVRSFLRARGAMGALSPQARPVERLLEFQVTAEGIVRTATAPIALELLPAHTADGQLFSGWNTRNWEGLVRLQTAELDGFLLVTDHFPATILAFVPNPIAPAGE